MTQAQWLRATGTNPSKRSSPSAKDLGADPLLLPVDQVSWDDCNNILSRLGLLLPTEAQWERGARGGTTTVWWTGDSNSSLSGKENVADRFAKALPRIGVV